jgi:galactose mutarotase-like enzyme
VNLSNHVYFNLGGHGSGWDQMKRHVLTIPHNQFTPDDSDYLPTGIVPDNNDCI